MSYSSIDALINDAVFAGRSRAACLEQAEIFADDQRPDFVAVAHAVMRDEGGMTACFARLAAAGPGIGDKVDTGAGTIDQTKITDADLLALTQANWPTVAELYFDDAGAPL